MKVHLITPYSLDKELGKAYNESMELIPKGDFACITDFDVVFLDYKFYDTITKYCNNLIHDGQAQRAMMTCYTNRIHPLAKEQLLNGYVNENTDFLDHIRIANVQREKGRMQIDICEGPLSGFLMVMSKEFWEKNKFSEQSGCLGIDTEYYKRIREQGNSVYLMKSLYVWHTYRLEKGIYNKEHLV